MADSSNRRFKINPLAAAKSMSQIRQARNDSELKTAAKNAIRRRIRVNTGKRLLPYISGFVIGLILALLGWFAGAYIATTVEEVTRPFAVTQNEDKCGTAEETDNAAIKFALILTGNEDAAKLVGDAAAFFETVRNNIFGLQEEEGCREFDLVGVGKWVWPIPEPPFIKTSPFGPRIHPITGELLPHNGQDYGKACGTPVYAATDGTVTFVNTTNFSRGGGHRVYIKHDVEETGALLTTYMHLRPGTIVVGTGQSVRAGDVIAQVGNTGASTGCHLHFEVILEGLQYTDPHKFIEDRIAEQEAEQEAEDNANNTE